LNNITFNKVGYRKLLVSALKNKYEFVFFNTNSTQEFQCKLRHDVDVNIQLALEMAILEASLGVHSTYFMMLRSPVYNLFSRENDKAIREIIRLGHQIGLHYDEGFYPKAKSLQTLVDSEVKIISEIFESEIEVVSFHQPSSEIISGIKTISNFKNTYSLADMNNFHYLSDSNKVWKENPLDCFEHKTYSKIQLLIHPIWWMAEIEKSTERLWSEALIKNFEVTQEQLLSTERAYGEKKIMILKSV
tara:strand:+ start:69 stop:806 length:738 start_codon:yes stop_codon:yes gene_type:complete